MLTQIKANGTTIVTSNTKSSPDGIVPHLDLGTSALDSVLYYSNGGLIKLKAPEEWATTANIWCPTIDATINSPVTINQNFYIDRTKARTANSLATLATYADIPTTLLVTAMGSLDIQFSIQNKFTSSVDSPGLPNYISNFVCNYFADAPLSTGYSSTTNDDYNTKGTPQSGPPSIVGNASSKGVNYTVINAQYNRNPSNYDDSGNLLPSGGYQTPIGRLTYVPGTYTYNGVEQYNKITGYVSPSNITHGVPGYPTPSQSLKNVTDVRYGNFLNTYGVWYNLDPYWEYTPTLVDYTVNITTPGLYYFTGACSCYVMFLYVDGYLRLASPFNSSVYDIDPTITFSGWSGIAGLFFELSAGIHTFRVYASHAQGGASGLTDFGLNGNSVSFAATLNNYYTGEQVWNTRTTSSLIGSGVQSYVLVQGGVSYWVYNGTSIGTSGATATSLSGYYKGSYKGTYNGNQGDLYAIGPILTGTSNYTYNGTEYYNGTNYVSVTNNDSSWIWNGSTVGTGTSTTTTTNNYYKGSYRTSTYSPSSYYAPETFWDAGYFDRYYGPYTAHNETLRSYVFQVYNGAYSIWLWNGSGAGTITAGFNDTEHGYPGDMYYRGSLIGDYTETVDDQPISGRLYAIGRIRPVLNNSYPNYSNEIFSQASNCVFVRAGAVNQSTWMRNGVVVATTADDITSTSEYFRGTCRGSGEKYGVPGMFYAIGDLVNSTPVATNYYGIGQVLTSTDPNKSNVAVNVMSIITMVIDAAKAAELEDNKYMITDPNRINAKWRGNFRYTAFSSLFKIREERFWDRGGYQNNFAQEIQMTAVSDDPESSDYGKFNVTIKAESPRSDHAKNLGFRWLVSTVKYRNFIT